MKKNLNFFALLVLSFTLLLSGCSKDENPVVESDNFDPYFSAKIEGQPWSATTRIVVGRNNLSILIINGNDSDTNFQLFFEENKLRVGTHILHGMNQNDDDDNGVGQFSISNNGGNYTTMFHSTGGSCTITTLTKTEMAGTFEFYAQDGFPSGPIAHVTEGKFRVKLPQ